jgi:hypothetical protein
MLQASFYVRRSRSAISYKRCYVKTSCCWSLRLHRNWFHLIRYLLLSTILLCESHQVPVPHKELLHDHRNRHLTNCLEDMCTILAYSFLILVIAYMNLVKPGGNFYVPPALTISNSSFRTYVSYDSHCEQRLFP